MKSYGKALADFGSTIRIDPQSAICFCRRGQAAIFEKKNLTEARSLISSRPSGSIGVRRAIFAAAVTCCTRGKTTRRPLLSITRPSSAIQTMRPLTSAAALTAGRNLAITRTRFPT